jgi:hypothetical protein
LTIGGLTAWPTANTTRDPPVTDDRLVHPDQLGPSQNNQPNQKKTTNQNKSKPNKTNQTNPKHDDDDDDDDDCAGNAVRAGLRPASPAACRFVSA